MALNRASDVSVADWRLQTHVKKFWKFFTRRDTVFLSGGNPHEALQLL